MRLLWSEATAIAGLVAVQCAHNGDDRGVLFVSVVAYVLARVFERCGEVVP
jgi:hypothetical protein